MLRQSTLWLGRVACFERIVSRTLFTETVQQIRSRKPTSTRVAVKGWAKRVHRTSKATFVDVGDGLSAGVIQAIIPRDVCSSVPLGCAIEVEGQWKRSEGRMQECELAADKAHVSATDDDPRYASLSSDSLRKDLSLRARSDAFSSLLRIRNRLTVSTHQFFQDEQFVHIDTPMVTENDCEGAGETFSIKFGKGDDPFFGQEVFLTVSSQLHLEAMTAGIGRVYTLGRAFRAEKNQSKTHLSEFTMLEAEVTFCSKLEDLLGLVERYVRQMVTSACSHEDFDSDLSSISSLAQGTRVLEKSLSRLREIPVMKHSEAIEILKAKGHPLPPSGSLSRSAELALVDYSKGPVFVTHFPSSQKPFYMKRNEKGETESFDLLCPGIGELVGGSLRVESKEEMERNLEGASMNKSLEWYANLHKRGKPPSGGFGIGFERLIQCLLEVNNIKDTIPFPRWFKHCKC